MTLLTRALERGGLHDTQGRLILPVERTHNTRYGDPALTDDLVEHGYLRRRTVRFSLRFAWGVDVIYRDEDCLPNPFPYKLSRRSVIEALARGALDATRLPRNERGDVLLGHIDPARLRRCSASKAAVARVVRELAGYDRRQPVVIPGQDRFLPYVAVHCYSGEVWASSDPGAFTSSVWLIFSKRRVRQALPTR